MRKAVCALLSIVLLVSMTACEKTGKRRLNYEDAKKETIEFFYENKDDLLSVATEIDTSSYSNYEIEGITSIWCEQDEMDKFVQFLKTAYGMLGGQYWGIYYSSNNKPKSSFIGADFTSGPYEGSFYWSEPNNGGNFYATERIEECWFFYYMDFDGHVHELDWANK